MFMTENTLLAGRAEMDLTINTAGIICSIRATALIIKNNMFLAAKSADYDCYYTVGGGVRAGESSEDAVIREVYEEIGYRLEIDRLAFIGERFCEIDGQLYHEISFFYLMKNCTELDIMNNSSSDLPKETLHWLPISDLPNINLVPKFLRTKSFGGITGIEHIISKEW